MEIVIDTSDSKPIFAQLIQQIKDSVTTDELEPGFALPSIRQLANDLGLNPNTVAKAYRLLERDLVIETKGHRGTFIHPQAKQNSQIDLNQLALESMTNSIESLRNSGLTDSEIRNAFNKVIKE
jgi:GntR family transcriptional regulator